MKKILFLLGSSNLSGGTYVILQHARYLASCGHSVTIALVFMTLDEHQQIKQSDRCWHPAIKELDFIHISECKNYTFDLAIYTWWATLFSYENVNADKFIYFVQSIESKFYANEQSFIRDLVNRTYRLGLPVITEATWIKEYLENNYQSQVELVKNGILKSVYNELGSALAEKSATNLRILVEGPIESPFKNIPRTIELCKEANVGEVWWLTSSDIKTYPGVDRVFSRIPIEQVPEIYRSCDVLVKLSYVEGMFGPPLEIFHCGGTAIVYDVTGHDEYIKHNVNALVATTDDENAVLNYLKFLQHDRQLLARLTRGAKQTALEWIDWNKSSADFSDALDKIVNSNAGLNQSCIIDNIKNHLIEHLDVVFIKDNNFIHKRLSTTSLYDSGHYAISIPLNTGNTQFSIQFGKHYQEFQIINMAINNNGRYTGTVNIALEHITTKKQGFYSCLNEQSGILVNTDIQSNDAGDHSNCQLTINFAPIALRHANQL